MDTFWDSIKEFIELVPHGSTTLICLIFSSVYSATCTTSTEVSQNNTYLRNPSYPSAYPTSTTTTTCGYKISKAASTVCQLRLDYETLVLGQTAATGVCTDSLATTTTADNSVT